MGCCGCGCLSCNFSYLISCGGLLKICEIGLGSVCLFQGILTYNKCIDRYGRADFVGAEYELGFLALTGFFLVCTFFLLLFDIICACCLIKTVITLLTKVYFLIGTLAMSAAVVACLFSIHYISSGNGKSYPNKEIMLSKIGLTFLNALLYFLSIFIS